MSTICWNCGHGYRENQSQVWCSLHNKYCARTFHCTSFIIDPRKKYAPEEKTGI